MNRPSSPPGESTGGEGRDNRPFRIVTVCTGNICRSPMAEYALRQAAAEAGLRQQVSVESVGTSGWEVGNPVDPRAGQLLRSHGIDPSAHRARAMDQEILTRSDLILALDHDHVEPIRRLLAEAGDDPERVRMLRSFDPAVGEDDGIRDPWYGDESDFDLAWDQIRGAVDGILDHARTVLEGGRDE